MKLRRIHAENYKTYKTLDLNLEVTDERPIILIGGANGCGKTTLFDAIYHALYGLKIKNARQFEELFNAGVKNASSLYNSSIVLEISFSGMVLNREQNYQLVRQYRLETDGRVLESVKLNMGGNQYVYGSGSTATQRAQNEEIINKVIAANLPAELSNYFLFDAMKTSELVKEEQINNLIMKNLNSVMGFNKYSMLQRAAQLLLEEKKAARLENDNMRKEYQNLTQEKGKKEEDLKQMQEEYSKLINFANDNREEYEQRKAGRNSDEITRDKMQNLENLMAQYYKREKEYKQNVESMSKDLEVSVIYPKLADIIRTEIEVVLNAKNAVKRAKNEILSDDQISGIIDEVVKSIERQYTLSQQIDKDNLLRDVKNAQNKRAEVEDKYAYINANDTEVLRRLIQDPYTNPFIPLDETRNSLNNEQTEMPNRKEQIENFKKELNASDYTFLEQYERNDKRLKEIKQVIDNQKEEIKKLETRIAKYDYDIPQIPDPQYDMLCKLPDFFKNMGNKLLREKKANIERMMKEQLNINLVIYAGVIGRVELSSAKDDEISFKIYHQDGNEIFLSQLNAGAKQTVMQVLLKVLYSLGDYEPPVMIDTVMGVLDKESRNVILERYFPDLAKQTILLSTDTEITTEHDFARIQAYVSHTYTLHRDKIKQCTEISNDYFGMKTNDF